MKKPTYYIYVKYPGEAKVEYDRTMDKEWSIIQRDRAALEHKGAQVTREEKR